MAEQITPTALTSTTNELTEALDLVHKLRREVEHLEDMDVPTEVKAQVGQALEYAEWRLGKAVVAFNQSRSL